MFKTLRGILCALLLAINLVFIALTIIIIGILTLLMPIKSWRRFGNIIMQGLPVIWGRFNHYILAISLHKQLDISGSGTFSRKEWYVMLSNHQSWMDILVITSVFYKQIPCLKFFMKQQLLWQLPFAGLACYFLNFPFMKRHSRAEIRKNPELKQQDIITTKKACQKFRNFPTTVINFSEGTRITDSKHQRQQSPYKYLLKPKAGGTAVAINEMRDILSGIIDVTINYKTLNNQKLNMWKLICGKIDKLQLRYELLPITPELEGDYFVDRKFRSKLQHWINGIWERKDKLIGELKND